MAQRLQVEEEFIAFCTHTRPPLYTPQPYTDPSPAELRALTHRRFYGALLLRDLGTAGGDEQQILRVMARFGADRGDLQRFWEAAELYLRLVRGMCEELNWGVLARLLAALRAWFKSRIPRSFACFLHAEDAVPLPVLQLLARLELTVRDVAELREDLLRDLLVRGMGVRLGLTHVPALMQPLPLQGECVVQPRREDYERFVADMARVATLLHRRAVERRAELAASRDLLALERELETNDLSVLVSPLVSEKEAMLNALENAQLSEGGERSDGVLSASDDFLSEEASEEMAEEMPPSKRRKEEYKVEPNEATKAISVMQELECEYGGAIATFQERQQYSTCGTQVSTNGTYCVL